MSQTIIEKLLKGAEVEWKPLGEVCDLKRGRVISKQYLAERSGQYPVYSSQTANQGKIGTLDTYDFDGEFINWTTDGANAGTVFYRNGKFSLTNVSGLINVINNSVLNCKYLFYWLTIEAKYHVYTGMGNPKLMSHQVKAIPIPIPPLSVQKEIVRILDAFTAHTTELIAELTAELNERKKQYNYYRDKLLTFSDEQVKWETIEEIFTLKNGYTPSKSVKEYWIGGTVPWFRMEDIRASGRMLTESAQKVHINGVKGKLFPNNSIIMSTSATVGEHALILTDFLCNQRFTNFSVREKYKLFLNIKYVYYYFFIIDQKAKETISISSFPSVQMDALKKWLFPIPPLSVQKEIVRKLDAFSMLTTSISAGLPREIELRNKQYKYYRGQLLNFSKPDLEI